MDMPEERVKKFASRKSLVDFLITELGYEFVAHSTEKCSKEHLDTKTGIDKISFLECMNKEEKEVEDLFKPIMSQLAHAEIIHEECVAEHRYVTPDIQEMCMYDLNKQYEKIFNSLLQSEQALRL